jgi:hypothetical protein
MDELQRALGKIEGLLEGIAREQERVANELSAHTAADAINFKALSDSLNRITGSRKMTAAWASGVSAVIVALAEVARAALAN